MAAKKKASKKKAKKKVAKKKVTKKKATKKKARKKTSGTRGPEPTEVDWKVVSKLCKIQCTGEEIASFLDISYDTLERACKREQKIKLAEYIAQKKLGGKVSLRRAQFTKALSGNPTMLIWAGKQYLGQTDKKEVTGAGGGPQEHVVMDKKEYEEIRKQMLKDDDV